MKLIRPSELRRISTLVDKVDDEVIQIAVGLSEIAKSGAGIAAPQIGHFRRIIAVNLNGIPLIMINPVIIEIDNEERINVEGCLSFPKLGLYVARPNKAVIRYMDTEGVTDEAATLGIETATVLHEIDHLDGILFIDRAITNRNDRRKIKRMFKVGCVKRETFDYTITTTDKI